MRGAFEKLEGRRLLAQSPQLLFEVAFDPTFSTGREAMSEIFQLDDHFATVLAVTDQSFRVQTVDSLGRDLKTYSAGPNISGRPDDVVQFYDQLYMFLDATFDQGGQGPGQEVWKFDLASGLTQVRDISPFGTDANSVSGKEDPFQFAFGDHLYFTADADVTEEPSHTPGNFGLWRTDGTEEGTTPSQELIPGFQRARGSVELNGRLLLSVNTVTGPGLWAFDGTAEGTQRLLSGVATTPVVSGNVAYFAIDSELGRELHVSDGTQEGTRLVADLNVGPEGSDIGHFVPYQNGLVFTADTESGPGLWYTDGTLDGTMEVFSGSVAEVELADKLYFVTDDGVHGLYHLTDAGVTRLHTSSTPIDLLGSTDAMLLFESGDETHTVGSKHGSSSPVPFAAPAEFRLATPDYFVFATKKVEAEFHDIGAGDVIPESIFSVQPWISVGTNASTQKLGEPAVRRVRPAFIEEDKQVILGLQDLDGYFGLRMYNHIAEGDFVRISAFAFDDIPVFTQGDANRDGQVDFADFLILSKNFGRTDAAWADGDFDASGEVDFADFLILSGNFGKVA